MPRPTVDPSRALRTMHFAMIAGLVLVGGVFVFLVRFTGFSVSTSPTLATVLAIVSIAVWACAITFLRRRVPERRSDEAPESYWSIPAHGGAAILLWAVTEGAALLGLIGYLLTGALAPAGAAALAIVTLGVFRPSHLEGSA